MRLQILAVASLFFTFLSAQSELKIATGITPAQDIFNRIQAPFEKATGLKLVLVDARSPAAWDLLDKGKVDAAAGGLTWADWLKSIRDKGLRVPAEDETKRIQIGTDQIQVLFHPSTEVFTLSKDQLKGIFAGRITNWKAVAGQDAPILVLLDGTQIATNDTFRAQILDGEPFSAQAQVLAAGGNLLQTLADTPNGIGFAPKASIAATKVSSPVTPDINRPILLLIKGQKPAPNVQKLIDFIASPEGQALVVK